MFDKDRFKNATVITSDGRIRCCLCALTIEDKEEYLDGGEGNSAHINCAEDLLSENFPFDRKETQANLDKTEYEKPISLLATLSKIEVKSSGEKKIKLTFEIKITEALVEICGSLGIKAYDFLPGDAHEYSSANLDKGPVFWDQWFLDWSKSFCLITEIRNNFVEVGHVGRFHSPKIVTKDLCGRETVILVIHAEAWKSDIELLKNAYLDAGEIVSLKLRRYKRIEAQQELPLDPMKEINKRLDNNHKTTLEHDVEEEITFSHDGKSVKTTPSKLKKAAKLVKEHPEIIEQALKDLEMSPEAAAMSGELDETVEKAA